MPGWVYIVGGILLFLALLLSLKVNITVSYKQELQIYLRILFVRIRLFPKKVKYREKKKQKNKKQEKKPATESDADKEPEKDISPVKVVWGIREAVLKLMGKAMNKLHFKFARLNIEVGCSDAAKTAIVYGTVVQSVAYLLEILESISNVEISRFSQINVCSNFISQKSRAEAKITLYIRVCSAITVLLHLLKTYFIYGSARDKLTEDKNGKDKSE